MSDDALSESLKGKIQEAYRAWLAARGFKPRRGQREMIAAVARTLTQESDRIAVIEAGTGTGKTYAYLVPALLSGKKILISTGTKHLQEQHTQDELCPQREH